MRWRAVLGGVVLISACNYRAAFEDYCADTGDCQCTDGACCVVEEFACDQFECCEGLACINGRCAVPTELIASPAAVDFGRVTSDATARIVLENTGTAATPSALQVSVTSPFLLDAADCERVLGPSERCEVIVGCRPGAGAAISGALAVEYGRRTLQVPLKAEAGVAIKLYVSGAATITEERTGWRCPDGPLSPAAYTTCTRPFPFDAVLALRHGPVAEGYSMVSNWPCVWTEGRCTVVADVSKTVYAYAIPNLQILVSGTGTVEGVSPACSRSAESPWDYTYCSYPLTGSVTLTARPTAPATRVEWSNACSGGGDCVVNVQGGAYVVANFR